MAQELIEINAVGGVIGLFTRPSRPGGQVILSNNSPGTVTIQFPSGQSPFQDGSVLIELGEGEIVEVSVAQGALGIYPFTVAGGSEPRQMLLEVGGDGLKKLGVVFSGKPLVIQLQVFATSARSLEVLVLNRLETEKPSINVVYRRLLREGRFNLQLLGAGPAPPLVLDAQASGIVLTASLGALVEMASGGQGDDQQTGSGQQIEIIIDP